ncbi:MAG: sucrase ferredoxin [Anaerolineae bacterium]
MTDQLTPTRCFCNLQAIEKGLDPAGYAGNFDDGFAIEMPLPWKRNYDETGISQEISDLLALWLERYKQSGVYGHRPLLIAPDDAYSVDGMRRVLFYTRPDSALFDTYNKTAYLVPEDQLGALVWAWYENRDTLPDYDAHRQPEDVAVRDLLVCTHGTVDVACAKFGYPLYKHLRDTYQGHEAVRIWRVSHFGGHLFAPTMMDMPKGDYWAHLDADIATQIIERAGDVNAVYGHYRGWAGVSYGFAQAMERACLMREGWDWQGYAKRETIIAQDTGDEPQWADVRIDYRTPQGEQGAYLARVRIHKVIVTNTASNAVKESPYAQYIVDELQTLTS